MDEADCEIDRLARIAEHGQEHLNQVQWYELDEQNAGQDSLPKFRPTGSATPALSHAASDGSKLGKDCDAKVDMKGWPSINAFRVWKLAFKKAVASTSRRSRLAFKWITEVKLAINGSSVDCGGVPAARSRRSLARHEYTHAAHRLCPPERPKSFPR